MANVFALKPDIITIKLGTNDSKPVNWDAYKGQFEKDLIALVDTLSAMPSKPTIWLCLPCPAFTDQTGPTGIRGTVIKNEVIPIIKKVAASKGLNVIDIWTPMNNYPAFFANDQVHPNAEGHDSIAAIIYRNYLSKSTRIACIGNSITEYAFGTPGTVAKDAYPIKLGNLLGKSYYTLNAGKSGAYMQKESPFPYWSTNLIKKVIDFKPNIITIKLGTNDSRQQYWFKDKYIADARNLIDSLSTINPKPKIWLCLPSPAWKRNGVWPFGGINEDIIKGEVIPAIKQLAVEKGLQSIDLQSPFLSLENLVPDGVHPNAEGQDTLAHVIYRALKAVPTIVHNSIFTTPTYPEIKIHGGVLDVVFPVPVSGIVRLCNLDGKMVTSALLKPGEASTISLHGLALGRYCLLIETPWGRITKPLTLENGAQRSLFPAER